MQKDVAAKFTFSLNTISASELNNPSALLNEIQNNDYLTIYFQDEFEPEKNKQQLHNILNYFREFDKLGKKANIAIMLKNRDLLKEISLDGIKFENINLYFNSYNSYYTIDELSAEEEVLNKMVEEINTTNLTTYEKYIAVYNIVAGYKKYKASDRMFEAHDLKSALNSEFIVCNGFSMLLIALLEKVGIKAREYSVTYKGSVDADNRFNYESDQSAVHTSFDSKNHSRVLVNLEDKLYDVHGMYIADPTFDNDLHEELLNHSTMTFRKSTTSIGMFNLNYEDLILDVKNFEEFNEHINFLLDHPKMLMNASEYSVPCDDIELMLSGEMSVYEVSNYRKVVDCLRSAIAPIDENFYNIYKKYNFSKKKDFEDFFTEAGHYIVAKTNNEVDLVKTSIAYVNAHKKMGYFNNEDFKAHTLRIAKILAKNDVQRFPYETNDDDHTPVGIRTKL